MRIALVTYQYPLTGKGGIANISYNLYCGLKKAGHDVVLICNKDHLEGNRIFDDYKKIKGATYKNALKILRYRSDYDWIIATEEISAFPAYFLAKGTRCKLAILGHGTAMTQMRQQPYVKMLFNQVLARTDLFIANSKFTLSRLKEGFVQPKNAVVIHPGVDTKKFESKRIKTKKHMIFTSGALVPGRKQELFFEVMPKLIKKYPDLTYVLAGEGRKREEMEQRVKELGIEKNVQFLGHISKGINNYYNECELYVCIDEDHPTLGPESFGISLVEASAAGKPCLIIDNTGGNKEVVYDKLTGYVCKDINELGSKVDFLLSNKKVRDCMGGLAQVRAKTFDWKEIIKQYETVLLRYGI
jgi:phosphatidylinositol alpha-1,6-mannosyltransferase